MGIGAWVQLALAADPSLGESVPLAAFILRLLGSICTSRRRVPLRRTRPPIVLRPAEVGGKRGLFVPGRISIGSK
ncbi:MAG: hypothetical protein AT711_02365 [Thermoproteus sp. CIS_19]|nr:MAG: hypothetical protein AT711_02365 [Thermoproteus sp. CIS_19]